ncbi:MAG: dipeptidase PepE [Acidobacteriota bacterium]
MRGPILLISNSTLHGSGYLDHCEGEIQAHLEGRRSVLFVPYALQDLAAYAGTARERFARMDLRLDSVHETDDPRRAVEEAEAIFIGGGNTFRLLARLYEVGLLEPIRRRVGEGMPYIGSSAGSNVACPTIKTTNDMPIVQPPGFEALGLVPFNVNCHYLDPDPGSTHKGETREQRIREFHEMNEPAVVGLREGAILRVAPPAVELGGRNGGRLFRRGAEPRELQTGDRLDDLLV